MIKRLSTGVIAIIGIGLATTSVAAGNVERGKSLYFDHGCYSCHGYNGAGRRPLADDASGLLTNETVFMTYLRLRADQNPMLPANSMPNYSADVLNDADAIDIYAYIKILVDDPPALEEIPLLMQILQSTEEDADDDVELK